MKSKKKRIKEIVTLLEKLRNFGFATDLSGMKNLMEQTGIFIKDGKFWKGDIKFEEFPDIKLVVELNPSVNKECSVLIK